jgi:hydrogenase expression/formation protein HypD
LASDKRLNLKGFLCPGHVSTIIGTRPYESIVEKSRIGCCIAGFEPLDILEGIYFLLQQIANEKPAVKNQYTRVVHKSGNLKAQRIIRQVFGVSSSQWRGFGNIPSSGLRIREPYSGFDAEKVFLLNENRYSLNERQTKCRCADVLKGLISPVECPLFYKSCRPDNPIGPCMVSSEGACNAYYKYR